jgi:hypothetical protein
MSPTTHNSPPSPRQLRFLKSLAERTGTSFTYPTTNAHANLEIKRLLALKDSGNAPLTTPTQDNDLNQVYATAIQLGEVVGFGSAASWRKETHQQTGIPPVVTARVGERVELKRYRISDGERVLYGQRINGSVRITDRPASGTGRSYLVERELEHDGHSALQALVADYTQQAQALDAIPMASSIVRRDIEQATA